MIQIGFRAVFLLLAALTAPAASSGLACQPVPGRPNILFAIADDWSWPHAGAYGDPVVKTPTFDRVAGEGILFENAYVSSPSCTPSRAAIVTGQWHWRLEESANLWSTLQSKFSVYPDLLEDSGYFVGLTRKGWGPGDYQVGGRTRNPAGPKFNSFTEFLQKRPPDQPFCFWFGSHDPHRDYKSGSGKAAGMNLDDIRLPDHLPDHESIRSDVADYYWEVQRFDREVGEMLTQLEEMGELENTIVVITSDNGMPFPRAKANLYDAGTRVPLAILWPRGAKGDRVLEDFVSLTDLAPTFLEAAGVPIPEEMTGRSLLGLLQTKKSGRVDPSRSFVLTGKERHVPCQEAPDSGGTPMRSIRTFDYLYIRNFKPERWPSGTPNWDTAYFQGSWYGDTDNGPTKSYMVDNRAEPRVQSLFGKAFSKRPAEELYDLKKDPAQLLNLAENSEYRDVLQSLESQLLEQLKRTGDIRVLGQGDQFEQYPYYGGSPLKPGFKETPK